MLFRSLFKRKGIVEKSGLKLLGIKKNSYLNLKKDNFLNSFLLEIIGIILKTKLRIVDFKKCKI